MRTLGLSLLLLALLPGCTVFFGDDDSSGDSCSAPVPPSNAGADGVALPPQSGGLRNPTFGDCEFFGCGGGGGVLDSSGSPPASPRAAPTDLPDWGICGSPCEMLDEDSCRLADACRAIYVDPCAGSNIPCVRVEFSKCWPTAPSGPVRGSECVGLDAQECSRHDDCVAVHFTDANGQPAAFLGCQNEIAPAPSCGALSESDCISRSDCAPIYQGADCSCTPMGCTCNQQFFVSCVEGGSSADLACGPYDCRSSEYCEHGTGGAVPGVDNYACKPLPAACSADSTCACLASEPCAAQCEQAATGFTLTCLYP
jgi:hypothetical protein